MLKQILVLSLAGLAAGSSAAADEPGRKSIHTERAEAQLARELAGRVAGPPQGCINRWDADRMRTVGDHTIMFRSSGKVVYVNEPMAGCPMEGPRRLERISIGTNMCRGEQLNVVDNQTGAYFGTCILGDFVPWRREG